MECDSERDAKDDVMDARMAWGGAFGAGKSGSSSVWARIYFARNVGVGFPGSYVSTVFNGAECERSRSVFGGAEAKSPKSSSREDTARVAGPPLCLSFSALALASSSSRMVARPSRCAARWSQRHSQTRSSLETLAVDLLALAYRAMSGIGRCANTSTCRSAGSFPMGGDGGFVAARTDVRVGFVVDFTWLVAVGVDGERGWGFVGLA